VDLRTGTAHGKTASEEEEQAEEGGGEGEDRCVYPAST
jgi:hypothetical protein